MSITSGTIKAYSYNSLNNPKLSFTGKDTNQDIKREEAKLDRRFQAYPPPPTKSNNEERAEVSIEARNIKRKRDQQVAQKAHFSRFA